ncbi:uncharacterized protein LOC117117457 isoform X2 [Anneissia japonica]|uniref:uncharacterized protein LOC117117457 isoform X2 n=1 Tax=Anneissia japonica TaxID=1529436 RepID=UPI001425859E|nr:uncharacterized protein LOC117117457 isoform X2 [Anneissia japonica]
MFWIRMRVRNTIYLSLCWFFCIQCKYYVDGMCDCCCKGDKINKPTCDDCQSPCQQGECRSNNDSEENVVVAVVVSCCVVIVIIAILITVCYWIHKKNKGKGSNSKSSTVRYSAENEKVDIEGETSVATQPLPAIPVQNHYIPSTLQQNTYEQIDPEYIGLQQDKNDASYSILQLNNDAIPNGNSSAITDMSETTNLKLGEDKSETMLNSNVSIDKPIPAYYTLQRDENSDVTETSHTIETNGGGEADDYAMLRQSDIEEESYSKLNHNTRKTVPNDVTDDYNKLIPTPAFDEESEEYSHFNRTSLNVDESVKDPGYGKLNLSKDEPAESTAKSNDGYEETLPGDVKPKYVTPGGSEQLKDNNRVEKTNKRVEKANMNNGYEEAIIKNSDQREGKSNAERENLNNGYEDC